MSALGAVMDFAMDLVREGFNGPLVITLSREPFLDFAHEMAAPYRAGPVDPRKALRIPLPLRASDVPLGAGEVKPEKIATRIVDLSREVVADGFGITGYGRGGITVLVESKQRVEWLKFWGAA